MFYENALQNFCCYFKLKSLNAFNWIQYYFQWTGCLWMSIIMESQKEICHMQKRKMSSGLRWVSTVVSAVKKLIHPFSTFMKLIFQSQCWFCNKMLYNNIKDAHFVKYTSELSICWFSSIPFFSACWYCSAILYYIMAQ